MNKFSQKTLIFSILLLAGLILVVSGCLKKPPVNTNQPVNQNQNTDTATTTGEIDTSNWKSYRNEEYGFEFKYPGEVEGKKFSIYFNESIKSSKNVIFGVAITPTGLGYQDHLLIFNVIEKNSKEIEDLLPIGVLSNQKELKRNFQVNNKSVVGYESKIKSGYNEDLIFISQWLLIPGIQYDYYINSGFFENQIQLYKIISGIIFSFNSF